jgi:hypothetical protein
MDKLPVKPFFFVCVKRSRIVHGFWNLEIELVMYLMTNEIYISLAYIHYSLLVLPEWWYAILFEDSGK